MERIFEARRAYRQRHRGIQEHRCGDRLDTEDVQLMPNSEATDDRPELAHADEADLLGQRQDGGEGLFTPAGR